MKKSPIHQACEIVGGPSALARLLGVSKPTVSEWRSGKRRVPFRRCITIEQETGIACAKLRPDLAADFAFLRAAGK